MKICNDTLNVLKNYASINSNIIIKPGAMVKTLAPSKNIFAEAKVPETFDKEFGIWDLNKFLATVSLFKDPDFLFEEKFVRISSAATKASINYYYSDPSVLTQIPSKFKIPDYKISFTISNRELIELTKAASVLQVKDMAIEANENGVFIRIYDRKDKTSNEYTHKVLDNNNGLNFCVYLNTENLKLLTGDYTVSLSEKICEFKNSAVNLSYWLAVESDSRWTS